MKFNIAFLFFALHGSSLFSEASHSNAIAKDQTAKAGAALRGSKKRILSESSASADSGSESVDDSESASISADDSSDD